VILFSDIKVSCNSFVKVCQLSLALKDYKATCTLFERMYSILDN